MKTRDKRVLLVAVVVIAILRFRLTTVEHDAALAVGVGSTGSPDANFLSKDLLPRRSTLGGTPTTRPTATPTARLTSLLAICSTSRVPQVRRHTPSLRGF